MFEHPCEPAVAIASAMAANSIAARLVLDEPMAHRAGRCVTAIIANRLRTSIRSLLDRVDAPQQEAGALPKLSRARSDVGRGSPGSVALIAQVIFELHFLLG